jgi:alpha-amylase
VAAVKPPADDFPFGRELSYQNCNPPHVTEADAIDYLIWAQAHTGAVGFRFDDTKGTHAPSVRRIMDALPSASFYSEYFDGDPANINSWATSPPMSARSAVTDFPLHWRIQAACNGFDATQFDAGSAGYWQWNSGLSVGFVDNPDTDTSPGQQVISNKGLAYAYLLSLPLHLALIYGKDYFSGTVWPGSYGLKPLIDNLCWISRTFAIGAYQVRWVDRDVHVASRDGNGGPLGQSGGLLTALNFNVLSPRTITCSTPFGPNRWLHDYTGHHPDISTDRNGDVTFTIPSNAFSSGQSYLCFAPGGVDRPFPQTPHPTTQTFFAASDLDIMPATNISQQLSQRIFCAKDTKISLRLSANLSVKASLTASVSSSDNKPISRQRIGAKPEEAFGMAPATGWYTISVEGSGLPESGSDYELAVTYLGATA